LSNRLTALARGTVRIRIMHWLRARVVLAVASIIAPRLASASGGLDVTRADAADQCPDSARLGRMVSAARLRGSTPPNHDYRVTFQHADEGFRAELVDQTTHRTRVREDPSSGCQPIAQAAAVVLATMWESERDAPPEAPPKAKAPPAPPPVVASPPSPPSPSPPPSSSPADRPHWLFGVGAAAAAAIVRPLAPALTADASFTYGAASFGVGGLWIPTQRIALGPGAVDVGLVAGSVVGCLAWLRRFGVCGGVFGGRLAANAHGYSQAANHDRPWFALDLEAFVRGSTPLPWLGYRVSAGPLVPLHSETFSVAGVGVAYDTPSVGALLRVALELRTL